MLEKKYFVTIGLCCLNVPKKRLTYFFEKKCICGLSNSNLCQKLQNLT